MNIEIIEIQNSYYDYVKKVGEGCTVIADLIQQEKTQKALLNILNFTEGLNWILRVEDIMLGHQYSIESSMQRANEFLVEINHALENNDYVLVADLLEYEIKPIFDQAKLRKFTLVSN